MIKKILIHILLPLSLFLLLGAVGGIEQNTLTWFQAAPALIVAVLAMSVTLILVNTEGSHGKK